MVWSGVACVVQRSCGDSGSGGGEVYYDLSTMCDQRYICEMWYTFFLCFPFFYGHASEATLSLYTCFCKCIGSYIVKILSGLTVCWCVRMCIKGAQCVRQVWYQVCVCVRARFDVMRRQTRQQLLRVSMNRRFVDEGDKKKVRLWFETWGWQVRMSL